MLNHRLAILLSGLALAGCASTPPTAYVAPYVAPVQVVHIPAVDAEAEAEIGQTIISTANLSRIDVVIVSKDISDYKRAELLNNRWSGRTNLHSGTFEKSFENSDGSFYRDQSATFTITGTLITSPTIPCECGVFIPKNASKAPVTYVYHREIGSTGYDFGETPLEIKSTVIEKWGRDSFKRELIYGGISGNTISISYREFSDGTARPAFTQDLKYDLSESKVIGFRGARFEVSKASNVSLKYKVLKPLD